MRKRILIVLVILTALSVAGMIAFRILSARSVGGEPPVITFDQNVLEVTTDASDDELLQGVSASDAEDGDVTDSLLVETSTHFVSDSTIEVTYAAFDSQRHVTKATRSVHFVNYTPPRFYLTAPMMFSEAGVSELLGYVGARDCIDGDISSRVKITSMESGGMLNTPGEHMLEFRVTNSAGDTAYLPISVEVISGYNSARQISLSDYLVYLPVGSEFDPKAYLPEELADDRKLEIENEVQTDIPGVYDVHYSLDGGAARLIVVVEEV